MSNSYFAAEKVVCEKESILSEMNEDFTKKSDEVDLKKTKCEEALTNIATELENCQQAISELNKADISTIK